jgi:hypothetical protein
MDGEKTVSIQGENGVNVLERVGEWPTAAEVTIPDRDGHDTARWDRLVIEKIIQVRFLGRTVTGGTIGTRSRHGLGIDWLGQDVCIPILRRHEKALRLPFYR